MSIWIDADACPRQVKEVIFRAAERTATKTVVVANKAMFVPRSPLVSMIKVPGGDDMADDYIVEHATAGDICVTQDIPLAARLVERRVIVIQPHGDVLDEDNVGERLSVRDFLTEARDLGMMTGGPAAFSAKDKQRFANALDRELQRARRG